jgi:hypothetical protein
MNTAASFIGLLIASQKVIGNTRPDATPGKEPAPSILARLKPKQRTQGPPLAFLSNHIRRDIGLDPIPEKKDRWSDHRI